MTDSTDMWRAIREIADDLERLRKADVGGVAVAYTPTYVGGTTAGATTYTLQQGSYVRLGPVVIATGAVIWTAATGTGNARISLPFPAVAVINFTGSVRVESVTFANSTPEVEFSNTQQFFVMRSPLTNAGGAVVQVEAAGNIIFTITYFI